MMFMFIDCKWLRQLRHHWATRWKSNVARFGGCWDLPRGRRRFQSPWRNGVALRLTQCGSTYGSLLFDPSNTENITVFICFQKVYSAYSAQDNQSGGGLVSFFACEMRLKLRGLDQDNEEVRLRLEDVGVFYEESWDGDRDAAKKGETSLTDRFLFVWCWLHILHSWCSNTSCAKARCMCTLYTHIFYDHVSCINPKTFSLMHKNSPKYSYGFSVVTLQNLWSSQWPSHERTVVL